MKLLKKLFAIIMTVMLISGLVPLRNCGVGNIESVNAQVNMTAEEAIKWVKSKVGQPIDVDGVYGAQCVDLAKAYYTFLGFRPVQGNGSDYTHNVLPPGYVRIQGAIPRKGDILVYTGGAKGYGHVAIYESMYSTYHQNFGGNQYVMHVTDIPYDGMTTVNYWGVIRPDFQSESDIVGYLDVYTGGEGSLYVAGWAADFYSKNTNLEIQIFIGGTAETEGQNGTEKHIIVADKTRQDVEDAFPGVGKNHGYEATFKTTLTGKQDIYAYAVNTASNCRVLIGIGNVDIKKSTVPNEVKLNKSNVTLTPDKPKVSLKVTVLPEYISNKDVIWTSSNINVVTVNSNGVLKSVGNGSAIITATTMIGNVTAQCEVEVKGLTHEGMQKAANGNWYYYKNGAVDSNYTGMAKNYRGWWYMTNGALDRTYTGMAKNYRGWWYMTNGALDRTYTGMAKNQYGWWYMTNGALDRTYTGMAKNQYGWWYMTNGALDRTYTGMAKNQYGWWYITNGALDRTFTGIGTNAYGKWYMKDGMLQSTFSGKVTINKKVYTIKNGKAE